MHFCDFSIIDNIKVTLPNHHLPRPTSTENQEEKNPCQSYFMENASPEATSKVLGQWQDSPHQTPQLNSGTCPTSQAFQTGLEKSIGMDSLHAATRPLYLLVPPCRVPAQV